MKQVVGGYEAKKNVRRRSSSNGGCKIEASIRRMINRKRQEKFAPSSSSSLSSSSSYCRIRSVKLHTQQHDFQVPSLIVNRDQTENSKNNTSGVQSSLISIEKVMPSRDFSSKQQVELTARPQLFLETNEFLRSTHIRNLMKSCCGVNPGVTLERNWKSSPDILDDVGIGICNRNFNEKVIGDQNIQWKVANLLECRENNSGGELKRKLDNKSQNQGESEAEDDVSKNNLKKENIKDNLEIFSKNNIENQFLYKNQQIQKQNCLPQETDVSKNEYHRDLKDEPQNIEIFNIRVNDEHQVIVTVKGDPEHKDSLKTIHSRSPVQLQKEKIMESTLEDNGISEIVNDLIKNFMNFDETANQLQPVSECRERGGSSCIKIETDDKCRDDINSLISDNERLKLSEEHMLRMNDDDVKLQITQSISPKISSKAMNSSINPQNDTPPHEIRFGYVNGNESCELDARKEIEVCEHEKLKQIETIEKTTTAVDNNPCGHGTTSEEIAQPPKTMLTSDKTICNTSHVSNHCHLKKNQLAKAPSNELELKFREIRARLDKQLQNQQYNSNNNHNSFYNKNDTSYTNTTNRNEVTMCKNYQNIYKYEDQQKMEGVEQKMENNQQNTARRVYTCACKMKCNSSPRRVDSHRPKGEDDSKVQSPSFTYCQCAQKNNTTKPATKQSVIIPKPAPKKPVVPSKSEKNKHTHNFCHEDLIKVRDNLRSTTRNNQNQKKQTPRNQMSSILKSALHRAALLPENHTTLSGELDLEQDWDNSVDDDDDDDDSFNDQLTHIVFPKETLECDRIEERGRGQMRKIHISAKRYSVLEEEFEEEVSVGGVRPSARRHIAHQRKTGRNKQLNEIQALDKAARTGHQRALRSKTGGREEEEEEKEVETMQSNGTEGVSENGVDRTGWTVGLINGKFKYLTAETFGFKINANGSSLKKKQLWTLEGSEHQVFLRSHLDRYLAVDQFGNVTCEAEDTSDPGCSFQIQLASDGSGRWALKNVQRGYFLGSSQDELKCTAKAPGEAEYWLVHLAARPQVNLRSAGRKRFAHLSATQDEIHVDAPVPWGEDTLFTLEFRPAANPDNDPVGHGKSEGGHYALHTCNNKYLARDGKLLDSCTRDCLYAAEFHAGLLALRDIHGAYLAPIGSKAVLKSRSTTVTRDELFSLEESLPQASFVAALNQRYVSVKQGVDVTANQDEISGHETFQLEFDRVTKRWYIRTMQDRYWSLEAGGGIQASDHKRSSNALFDLVWQHEDGTVALRANNGKFLATKRSGHLYANSDSPNSGDSDASKYYFYLMNRPILVLRCEQGFVGPKSAASPKLECNKAGYETIRVERCERGIVRFKGQNGKYWNADSEGVTVDADQPSVGFYLELREPSRICIKSTDGRYLAAGKNGALRLGETDHESATKWEF